MEDRLVVRYRKGGKDDDIKNAMENLPAYVDRADVVRAAMRAFLFGIEDNAMSVRLQTDSKIIKKQVTHDTYVEINNEDDNEVNELSEIEITDDDIESNLNDMINQF